jgi:urease accessory protein
VTRWLRKAGTVVGALVAGAGAGVAQAHGTVPGIGAFYNGALHPLATPAQCMALLGLGLLVGQHMRPRNAAAAPPLLALAVALAAGLLLHRVAGDPDTDRVLLGLALVLGGLVLSARTLPAAALVLLAVATGSAVALGSGPEGLQGRDRWVMLAGSGLAALLISSYAAVMVSLARPAWLQVAVRVLGSWIASAALLVLALSLAAVQRGAA